MVRHRATPVNFGRTPPGENFGGNYSAYKCECSAIRCEVNHGNQPVHNLTNSQELNFRLDIGESPIRQIQT